MLDVGRECQPTLGQAAVAFVDIDFQTDKPAMGPSDLPQGCRLIVDDATRGDQAEIAGERGIDTGESRIIVGQRTVEPLLEERVEFKDFATAVFKHDSIIVEDRPIRYCWKEAAGKGRYSMARRNQPLDGLE